MLEDFHIRKGSGGRGQWNAGDGIRRTIRFLEKMDCTILSGHRRVPPFGLAGGEDGQVGENSVRRNDGSIETLQGGDATVIDAGEAHHHPDADRGGIWQAGVTAPAHRFAAKPGPLIILGQVRGVPAAISAMMLRVSRA